MSAARRPEGYRIHGSAADAFEAVAWKVPTAQRFESRVANDPPRPEPTFGDVMRAVPGWVVVLGGGVVAALAGAMLGGMLQL